MMDAKTPGDLCGAIRAPIIDYQVLDRGKSLHLHWEIGDRSRQCKRLIKTWDLNDKFQNGFNTRGQVIVLLEGVLNILGEFVISKTS